MVNPDNDGCQSRNQCDDKLKWHGTSETIGSTVAGAFKTLKGAGNPYIQIDKDGNGDGKTNSDPSCAICMCEGESYYIFT